MKRRRVRRAEDDVRPIIGAVASCPANTLGPPSTCDGDCEIALTTSSLLWGVLFGSIGVGFFVYGKKQRAVVPLVCGLALMVFPYFISNSFLLVAVGIALMAIPYFVRM